MDFGSKQADILTIKRRIKLLGGIGYKSVSNPAKTGNFARQILAIAADWCNLGLDVLANDVGPNGCRLS